MTHKTMHEHGARAAMRGLPLILTTLACWTSIPLFLKYFSGFLDAWTANGWRYAVSALLWLPVLLWHAWRKSTPAGVYRAAIVPSVFNAIAQACFGLAPYFISPSLMTFSLRVQVIFLMVGAAIMFPSERAVIRHPLFVGGIVLLLGGTLTTIMMGESTQSQGAIVHPNLPLGAGLAIASGLFYALYALSVRKRMHGMPPLTAFAVVSQYTGVALVAAMLVLGDRAPGHLLCGGEPLTVLDVRQMWMLVASAIIGIGIGHTLYYASIQKLGLAVSSGVVQLQPFTVSLAGMAIFGTVLLPLQWATGTAAVVGAVLLLVAQHLTTRRYREAVTREETARTTVGRPA